MDRLLPYESVAHWVMGAGPILRGLPAAARDEVLPGLLSGERTTCFALSEPDAGSDLASLQTQAVADSVDFVIARRKVWTSDAHRADYVFLAAPTDPDAPKHRAISNFIVTKKPPGVTVMPLVNLADAHSFNQVF